MARLIQQSPVTSRKPVVNVPQMTPAVSTTAGKAGTTVARKPAGRYPRWFSVVCAIAILLTAWQLYAHGVELAASYGRITRLQHASEYDYVRFAVAPGGDRYLSGYRNGDNSHLELFKSTGELLWSRRLLISSLTFSADGKLIFNGTDALETTTGKVVARVPAPEDAMFMTWAARGNHAVWQSKKAIHVWDRAANKIRSIGLKKGYSTGSSLRISPDGKWLATTLYKYGEVSTGTVAVWNLSTLAKPDLYAVRSNTGDRYELTFSPDNRKLLYVGQGTLYAGMRRDPVTIWTLDKSHAAYEFASEQPAQIAAWSPGGEYFAIQGRGYWSVYNANSGELFWSRRHRTNFPLENLYFTKDNKLYYDGYSQKRWSLEYWDLDKVLTHRGGN